MGSSCSPDLGSARSNRFRAARSPVTPSAAADAERAGPDEDGEPDHER